MCSRRNSSRTSSAPATTAAEVPELDRDKILTLIGIVAVMNVVNFTDGADGLAAVARKTLPGYTGPQGYTFGTPAEKSALLSAINDIRQAKVLKVGIKQTNWLIDKNSLGIPTARYKHGVIWAQYPNRDDGFCRILWVNIKQDYAGGGTYSASYGYFVSRAFAGCPAGR